MLCEWATSLNKSVALKNLIGIIAVLLLAGCSSGSSLLNAKSGVPDASSVPVGNNLALPPDLQLAAPSATSVRYQPNGYVAPIAIPAARPISQAAAFADPGLSPSQSAAAAQAAAVNPTENVYANQIIDRTATVDPYARYGISRFRANGKLKSVAELKRELVVAAIAKKRETNPNYGTIGNFGNAVAGNDDFILKP